MTEGLCKVKLKKQSCFSIYGARLKRFHLLLFFTVYLIITRILSDNLQFVMIT